MGQEVIPHDKARCERPCLCVCVSVCVCVCVCVQNQDNNVAEAFKMRNMLGELAPEVRGAYCSLPSVHEPCHVLPSMPSFAYRPGHHAGLAARGR